MAIEEKWYDGKYYNQFELIHETNDTNKQYWGIEHAAVTIQSPSPSLFSVMSGKISFNSTMRVTIMEQTNEIDTLEKEMVARIAASALLTQEQLTEYMTLCGLLPMFHVCDPILESGIMRRRLNKLFDLELIEKVILSYSNGLPDITAYRITKLGQELAYLQGVCIHKGNMYQSDKQRNRTGLLDTPAEIIRILVANNIALRLLNETNNIRHLAFMTTLYIKGVKNMSTITRSALSIVREDGSSFLYEVFRRPAENDNDRDKYERYVKDKVRRYFALVQRDDFLEHNSQNLKTIPKLAIVAEDPAHLEELETLLTPIIKMLRIDERAEVIFITDYGIDPGTIYPTNFLEEVPIPSLF